MVFHLYFSFALKRRRCWQFELRKFQVKVFGRKGRKFLATKKFALVTKSKNLGASWPQGFFSIVEPCCTVTFNKISYGTQGKKPHQNKPQGSLPFTIFRGEGSVSFPYTKGGCSSPATYPTIHKVIIMTRWCSGYFNIFSCYFSSIWKPWFVLNSCNNVYSLLSHACTITRADTYFWHNLPLWKVCGKIYFPQQKYSFPKLKEAYFLLAIITNKLWEPLSSKSMSSRFFFLERVIISQNGTSTSWRIMWSKVATNTFHTY